MGEFERNKDQVQAGIQAGASLVGRITVIITDAVGSIAREVGDFVTEGIEMREAARAARLDEKRDDPADNAGLADSAGPDGPVDNAGSTNPANPAGRSDSADPADEDGDGDLRA